MRASIVKAGGSSIDVLVSIISAIIVGLLVLGLICPRYQYIELGPDGSAYTAIELKLFPLFSLDAYCALC
jgi:hypothetical protein